MFIRDDYATGRDAVGAGHPSSTSSVAPREHADARGAVGCEPRSAGTVRRRFLALSVAFLVAACTAVKVGYNNADTLITHSADSYFDLDDDQAELVRTRVRELMRWHRRTQLAAYSELIQRAQSRVGGKVTTADVLGFQHEINGLMATIGERAAPDIAQLSTKVKPAQIDHFANKLAESTRKARRELVRANGGDDQRATKSIERAEEWFGTLNREQIEMVRASLAARPEAQQWWIAERERRQRDAVTLLRRIAAEHPDEATATRWWRAYFAEIAEPRDPERRARVLQYREQNAALIAQLINSATPVQRTTVAKKLRGYADDFTTLATEGPKPST